MPATVPRDEAEHLRQRREIRSGTDSRFRLRLDSKAESKGDSEVDARSDGRIQPKIGFRIDFNNEPQGVSLGKSGGYGGNCPEIQCRISRQVRFQIQLRDRPGDESGIESQGGFQNGTAVAAGAAGRYPRSEPAGIPLWERFRDIVENGSPFPEAEGGSLLPQQLGDSSAEGVKAPGGWGRGLSSWCGLLLLWRLGWLGLFRRRFDHEVGFLHQDFDSRFAA